MGSEGHFLPTGTVLLHIVPRLHHCNKSIAFLSPHNIAHNTQHNTSPHARIIRNATYEGVCVEGAVQYFAPPSGWLWKKEKFALAKATMDQDDDEEDDDDDDDDYDEDDDDDDDDDEDDRGRERCVYDRCSVSLV